MSSQPGVAPSVHVVFSAECNHALTWQAVGLFHSHSAVGQPGNITRLLACSEEQLRTYRGMDVGPTFVHHNMRFGHPTLIDEAGYPSYNKPASVMFWLEQVRPTEEYIALLDTDMLLREPLDPIALGAAPGVVVSAEYSYLVGSEPQFARRFLDEHEVPLVVRCGGFHIFHREDIRRIAQCVDAHMLGVFVKTVLRVVAYLDVVREVLLGLNEFELFNRLDHHTDLLLGGLVTNESLYLRVTGYSGKAS